MHRIYCCNVCSLTCEENLTTIEILQRKCLRVTTFYGIIRLNSIVNICGIIFRKMALPSIRIVKIMSDLVKFIVLTLKEHRGSIFHSLNNCL